MTRFLPAAAAAVLLLASAPADADAQAGWTTTRQGDHSLTVPGDLPPGRVFALRTWNPQPMPADVLAWLDARVEAEARADPSNVQRRPAKAAANPQLLAEATRVSSAPGGRHLAYAYSVGRTGDGRIVLFRMDFTPEGDAVVRHASEAGRIVRGVLDGLRSTQTASARPSPTPRRSTPLAYAAAPGAGVKPGQIDRVLVEHYFGLDPFGGASNTYTLYAFLKDGRVVENPELALEDTDVDALARAEPKRVGRWSERAGVRTVTMGDGDTEELKLSELTPCRAARPGEMLNAHYSQTGGGSILGTVSLVSKELNFTRDGRFSRDGAVAVSGSNFGGGGSTGSAAGRYKLDGHLIQLEPAGGTPERRFFCIWGELKTVFVASSFWLVRDD